MQSGIDLSEFQRDVDHKSLLNKADFVMIRSSFGCPDPGQDASLYVDKSFRDNLNGFRAIGIKRGYYHYSYPQYNPAHSEVEQFLSTVGVLQAGEMLALDFEEHYGDPVPWCLAFLDEVLSRTGVVPFIYLNLNTVKEHDWSSVSARYPLWVAFWDNNKDAGLPDIAWPAGIVMHQYGLVDYMHADGDHAYVDLANYGKPIDIPIIHADPVVAPFKRFFVDVVVNLNVRKEPTTKAARVIQPTKGGYISPPFRFEVYGIAHGEAVNGNDIWFQSFKGNWIWSGGCSFDSNLLTSLI